MEVQRRRRRAAEEISKPADEPAQEIENEEDEVDDETRIIASYKEKISNPLTAIRAMCVECMGGAPRLVAECPSNNCALHPFRMGKNTMHGKYGKPNPKAAKVVAARRRK
jgi:hypothetical protein